MQSHNGVNLAEVFANILNEFGISEQGLYKKFVMLPT